MLDSAELFLVQRRVQAQIEEECVVDTVLTNCLTRLLVYRGRTFPILLITTSISLFKFFVNIVSKQHACVRISRQQTEINFFIVICLRCEVMVVGLGL